jgi:hypothetical protein
MPSMVDARRRWMWSKDPSSAERRRGRSRLMPMVTVSDRGLPLPRIDLSEMLLRQGCAY